VDNPLIFPTEEYLQNAHVFRTLEPTEEQEYNAEFQRVIGN
jgi:spermidine/putrescine transport system substrate-binding protein